MLMPSSSARDLRQEYIQTSNASQLR
jgi:hypothetical protein